MLHISEHILQTFVYAFRFRCVHVERSKSEVDYSHSEETLAVGADNTPQSTGEEKERLRLTRVLLAAPLPLGRSGGLKSGNRLHL